MTARQQQTAIDLANNGLSATRIAVSIGTTRSIVQTFLGKMGFVFRTKAEIDDEPFVDNLDLCDRRWRLALNGEQYR